MILLLDENLPARVADAMSALGTIEVHHVTKFLPRGAPDVSIFEFLADKPDWVLVTQDDKIRRRPQEIAALRQARVGVFVLTGRVQRDVEGMLAFLVSCLPSMRKAVAGTRRPFIIGISDRRELQRFS